VCVCVCVFVMFFIKTICYISVWACECVAYWCVFLCTLTSPNWKWIICLYFRSYVENATSPKPPSRLFISLKVKQSPSLCLYPSQTAPPCPTHTGSSWSHISIRPSSASVCCKRANRWTVTSICECLRLMQDVQNTAITSLQLINNIITYYLCVMSSQSHSVTLCESHGNWIQYLK